MNLAMAVTGPVISCANPHYSFPPAVVCDPNSLVPRPIRPKMCDPNSVVSRPVRPKLSTRVSVPISTTNTAATVSPDVPSNDTVNKVRIIYKLEKKKHSCKYEEEDQKKNYYDYALQTLVC